MKTFVALALALCFACATRAQQTNNVTGGNGADYTINTQLDPALTLVRGVTYVFKLSGVSGHPFNIRTSLGGSQFNTGVTGNGTNSGSLIFVVPTNAPNTLFYQCGIHSGMNGQLNLINPPTPPNFSIGGLVVSNRVVLRHAGTNTFTYTPEFTTNLVTTNWLTLTVQSNQFLNGTNEIFCGLPSGSNVFFRIRAQ